MNKELLLLRHGKSDWNQSTNDFLRPLKSRGKQGAQRIGTWLEQQNLKPDMILSSPATRAINTAEILCEEIAYPVNKINLDERIYAANTATLKTILAECPAHVKRLLLVGHNPGLEALIIELTGGNIDYPEDGKLMATATLAHLLIPDNWNNLNKDCAEILSITRASYLED